ncbi:MAG: hypothetical protein KKA62_01560 [Nanoarchaeota archaeon]|nr:hypothetical protein [Nanoarchaeota archaeon]MBU1643602.1 hypothetical protein [Nanoarchaeota archaeon]MBU1976619.1 hypothetical protein [Nanoarchaeota archaeon]
MEKKESVNLVDVISKLVSTLSEEEKLDLFEKVFSKEGSSPKESLPISIFRCNLSGLESIVVYLKDNKNLSVAKIAEMLNRKRSTIYTSYHKAKSKRVRSLDFSDESILIPLTIFSDRKISILESLVHHLKDRLNLSFVKIAQLLNKNYSTVRTVYKRYLEKCPK